MRDSFLPTETERANPCRPLRLFLRSLNPLCKESPTFVQISNKLHLLDSVLFGIGILEFTSFNQYIIMPLKLYYLVKIFIQYIQSNTTG